MLDKFQPINKPANKFDLTILDLTVAESDFCFSPINIVHYPLGIISNAGNVPSTGQNRILIVRKKIRY